ncbi:hypothetical protein NQ318_002839 [Aromia moschata]|uniref:Uncharacterized protein n=1 Tax=Aromia moschata TaxID=1265417 RepID=A0AAV8X061_9CUCU|nr:hypothetical protein NQ318_002839 [Aromia moschata]
MFSEAKRKELRVPLFGSTRSSTTSPAKKRKGNTSTDSEGLTGSPKRRRKFLRTFHNYASRNGSNNNPTAFQFYNTFKRLILQHDLKLEGGNCVLQDATILLRDKLKVSAENS